jgi:hypothetical protein
VTLARYSFSVALVIPSAAALAVPAVTEASSASVVRKLATNNGVTVSFDAPAPRGAARLVRFPRNRITLARRADQRLVLRARGRRLLVPGRARRVRVRVRLDVLRSLIVVNAGAGHLRRNLRLKAERRVVFARALKRVTVTLRRAPTTAPPWQAAPGTTAAPTKPPVAGPNRLFAATSVWKQPLAADAPIDPASGTLVQTLRDTVVAKDAWIQWRGTSPLYIAPAGQPLVHVKLDTGSWGAKLQSAFEAVPIPSYAVPAPGDDAHMTIYQPATDRLWEFFGASKQADGWHARWGGAMTNTSRSPGYYNPDSWPGLSSTHWGATATSLPVIAGTMMASELKAGVIPHAIAVNIPWAKPNVYAWPAQRTDGKSTDPNAIPEGARFRLDPNLNIDALNLHPAVRAIAIAAQRYGMIVRDQTGQAVALFAENTSQFGTNPYDGATGIYGGTPSNLLMRTFPWDKLKALKMELHAAK